MRMGLTFNEFVELRLKPRRDADQVFHDAAQQELENLFPMKTSEVAQHLRSRGYDCRPASLELLVEDGVITPASPDSWSQIDVETVAAHLDDCQILTPHAAMCETLGCRYAEFLRTLRDAAELASRKYGRPIPEDDQYFVLHRLPPRDDRPALISFTLADDIRERLERGEEV